MEKHSGCGGLRLPALSLAGPMICDGYECLTMICGALAPKLPPPGRGGGVPAVSLSCAALPNACAYDSPQHGRLPVSWHLISTVDIRTPSNSLHPGTRPRSGPCGSETAVTWRRASGSGGAFSCDQRGAKLPDWDSEGERPSAIRGDPRRSVASRPRLHARSVVTEEAASSSQGGRDGGRSCAVLAHPHTHNVQAVHMKTLQRDLIGVILALRGWHGN